MSSISEDWEALSSQHERLVRTTGGQPEPAAAGPVSSGPALWAELASQRERLVELADSSRGLASASQRDLGQHDPGRCTSGFRLVVKAA